MSDTKTQIKRNFKTSALKHCFNRINHLTWRINELNRNFHPNDNYKKALIKRLNEEIEYKHRLHKHISATTS